MAQKFSKPFYNSKEWKVTRQLALMRDNYLCVKCGEPAEEVHHKEKLTPLNINDPSIAMNQDNLICLCRDCHFKEHIKDKRYAEKKDTEEEFEFVNGILRRKEK